MSVNCYTVQQDTITDGILAQDFQSIQSNSARITRAQVIMYPLYSDTVDQDTCGDALYPVSVSFIADASKKQKQKQDAAILSIDPSVWTIAANDTDKSMLLDPSGNNRILLYAQTGRVFLKRRNNPSMFLTMPSGNKPVIQQVTKVQQAIQSLSSARIHPKMNAVKDKYLKNKLVNKLATKKQKQEDISDILTSEQSLNKAAELL